MMLTNKAKEDFLSWYGTGENYFKTTISNIEQNANIIEWLDNLGYIIEVRLIDENWWGFSVIEKDIMGGYYELVKAPIDSQFKNRQEAQEYAIEKINEIYNNLNK